MCVDTQDLRAHVRHGIPIGHVGHLVQPHRIPLRGPEHGGDRHRRVRLGERGDELTASGTVEPFSEP